MQLHFDTENFCGREDALPEADQFLSRWRRYNSVATKLKKDKIMEITTAARATINAISIEKTASPYGASCHLENGD